MVISEKRRGKNIKNKLSLINTNIKTELK